MTQSGGTTGGTAPLGWSSRQSGAPTAILLAVLTVVSVVATFPFADGKRMILAGAILLVVSWHMFSRSRSGLALAFVFLATIGGLRRFLIPYLGWTGFEPLLLVAPILTGLYVSGLVLRRTIPFDTPIAKATFWIVLVMLLQVFNPRQGGIIVGIAGMVYVLVPILWYYVGRNVANRGSIELLLTTVMVVAILSSMDGLRQTFVGLNAAEHVWLDVAMNKIAAKIYHFGGLIRAFGFSTSAEEYAFLLGVGFVLCWARFITGSKLALLPLPLLGYAIFWESSRGVLVTSLFTCAIVWALLSGNLKVVVVRSVIAIGLGAIGLVWSMQAIKEKESTLDKTQRLIVMHQTSGLLNVQNSTAGDHSLAIMSGFKEAALNPIGRGLGSTNIAGGKFGDTGGEVYGTEVDISDAFAGLGLVGGVLYLIIVIRVFTTSINLWRSTRDPMLLCVVAVLVMLTGRWLEGADGSLVMLSWCLAGFVDTMNKRVRDAEKAKAVGEAPNTATPSVPSAARPRPV